MRARSVLLLLAVSALLALPAVASAHPEQASSFAFNGMSAALALTHPNVDDGGADFEKSRNMKLISFLERAPRPEPGDFSQINSDLAFWGDTVYQGTWSGFRIIDADDPRDPVELIDYRDCAHPAGQGDMVVWGSILVRTWDGNNADPASTCDGEPVPAGTFDPAVGPTLEDGFEGLHVFDVSNPGNPDLVASVNLKCGSHTATGVPDLRNRRLIVYSTPSNGACDGLDIVEVPLSRPEESEALRFELAGRDAAEADGFACHDTGVILGRAMKSGCAGGAGFAIWSLGGRDGGSLDNPRFLYNQVVPEIAFGPPNANEGPTGHSAAFSWDGDTFIFGHEPGGGVDPRCMATGEDLPDRSEVAFQNDNQKSLFFYETDSGEPLGKWTHERPQSGTENCTIHNYNLVPTKRDELLVHGSYQSGVSVVDFDRISRAREIAFADPAPLEAGIGGDWSSYWYNGYIWESDIRRGLYVWRLDDRDVKDAFRLRHLNPQTQEFTIDAKKDRDRWNDDDRWHDDDDDDRDWDDDD